MSHRYTSIFLASLLLAGCADPCSFFGPNADIDGDGYVCANDCNDLSADIYPGAPELCDGWDNDCDGIVPVREQDPDGDGYRACGGDCGPTLAEVHPGAPEFCDGYDNDCDPSTPRWPGEEIDQDGDGSPQCADCDDTDLYRRPSGPEGCDGIDTDCNGIADYGALRRHSRVAVEAEDNLTSDIAANVYSIGEAVAIDGFAQRIEGFSSTWGAPSPRLVVFRFDPAASSWVWVASKPLFAPTNGDWWTTRSNGYFGLSVPLEANTLHLIGVTGLHGSTTAPFSSTSGDGQLPFGSISEHAVISMSGAASVSGPPPDIPDAAVSYMPVRYAQSLVWKSATEVDQDGDGLLMCNDCDDAGAEVCDGFDGDCDGNPNPDEVDQDGDGFASCAGDCDDSAVSVAPHAPEQCDGVDQNCLPEVWHGSELDADGDGYSGCEGDCNDSDASVYPGAPELCDSIDQDCDGDTEDWRVDSDGDGIYDCFDCYPAVDWIAPGLEETCASVYDVNCDGIPPTPLDADGDGFAPCDGDCDDGDASVFPGAVELEDGIDNDCNGEIDGLTPSVRVSWSNLSVDSLEPFWGPAGARRPRLSGDYVIFTRAADGSIVDLEGIELNPWVSTEDAAPQRWTHLFGSPRTAGERWLDAAGAVQLVLAWRCPTNRRTICPEPYLELDVQLLPEPTPYPFLGTASANFLGSDVPDCTAVGQMLSDNQATVGDMLEAVEGVFPWMELNGDNTCEELYALGGNLVGYPGLLCQDFDYTLLNPQDKELVYRVCRGLAHSSPAVRASVQRIDWVDSLTSSNPLMTVVGRGLPDGRVIISTTAYTDNDHYVGLVAHEAAHTFHYDVQDGTAATTWPGAPPAMGDAIDAHQASFSHNMPGIGLAFATLASSGAAYSAVSAACSPQTTGYTGSAGFPSADVEAAKSCGFAPSIRPGAHSPWYGRKSAQEDIATWTARAVELNEAGTPELFCADIGLSLAALPPERVLHLGKAIMLHMNGFLPPAISQGCMLDLLPDWAQPTGYEDQRIWTPVASSQAQFDDEVAYAPNPVVGDTLLVTAANRPLTRVMLRDERLENPFSGLISLEQPYQQRSNEPLLGAWIDAAAATESYVEHGQPNWGWADPLQPCWFQHPQNLFTPGYYGRSQDGVALVVSTADAIYGIAFSSTWGCGLTDFNGMMSHDTTEGSIVAFQVLPSGP